LTQATQLYNPISLDPSAPTIGLPDILTGRCDKTNPKGIIAGHHMLKQDTTIADNPTTLSLWHNGFYAKGVKVLKEGMLCVPSKQNLKLLTIKARGDTSAIFLRTKQKYNYVTKYDDSANTDTGNPLLDNVRLVLWAYNPLLAHMDPGDSAAPVDSRPIVSVSMTHFYRDP